MACRVLVFSCLLVGVVVAPPPGPPPQGPPPQGPPPQGPPPQGPPPQGPPPQGPPPPGPQPQGPSDSYDFGATSETDAPSNSFNDEMKLSAQLNQQNQQPLFTPAYASEGQKQGAQPQGYNMLGQGFYQDSFKPQDMMTQPSTGFNAQDLQQIPAFLQQNPVFQAFLQYQMSQKQQSPFGSPWAQSQLGGYGGFPGYGYQSSPYMQQSAGMGYMPSMYNHMPMVVETPHDSYGGMPMGMGGYGVPQMFSQPQAPQMSPGSQPQSQTPKFQGPQYFNPSQASKQKLQAKAQFSGKI